MFVKKKHLKNTVKKMGKTILNLELELLEKEGLISKVKNLVSDINMNLGLNTAHDYDGVESEEDIIIYLKAIKRKTKNND